MRQIGEKFFPQTYGLGACRRDLIERIQEQGDVPLLQQALQRRQNGIVLFPALR
ncbi:MAG: hypothetical protein ACREYC_20690 [Gammaproteobacteria bacterium]